MVAAGKNQEIPLFGWITQRFIINKCSAYRAFGVLKILSMDMLIVGEFLRSHVCQIMKKPSARDAFGIKDGYYNECLRNKEKMKTEDDPQL